MFPKRSSDALTIIFRHSPPYTQRPFDDGYVRPSVLEGRKRLVLVLLRLGAAMALRKICSAWSVLVGDRRSWAEQQSPVGIDCNS